jgi:bifunctional oligoribonuclease and PAP phosphatase NrnA
MTELHAAVRQRMATAQNILVTAHVRPDGDAIGSMLGLGLALQEAGKTVQMVLAEGIPTSLQHLPGSEQVTKNVEETPELFISVDCADRKRLNIPAGFNVPVDINIDHHITNENYAKLNVVEVDQVATACILTDHLPEWGLRITPPVAANFMTGLVTDTLGFRTSSMTPRAFRQAATLFETGIDIHDLYMRGLVRRSFQAARYWGAGLSKLDRADGMVWVALTLDDRKISGYTGNDDADLVNIVSAIEDCSVGLVFVEQKDNRVKVSWRALRSGLDVSRVAQEFGGGGHAAASGADIAGALATIQPRVLQKTKEMLNL